MITGFLIKGFFIIDFLFIFFFILLSFLSSFIFLDNSDIVLSLFFNSLIKNLLILSIFLSLSSSSTGLFSTGLFLAGLFLAGLFSTVLFSTGLFSTGLVSYLNLEELTFIIFLYALSIASLNTALFISSDISLKLLSNLVLSLILVFTRIFFICEPLFKICASNLILFFNIFFNSSL